MALAIGKFAAFFSYSRDDSSFVVRLAADLKAAGANVWLDQLDIAPGQRWDRTIEDALRRCPCLLVILSPTSVESTNVMDEVSFALEEKKTVIPVVYKDCVIPFRLRRLQYVDFKEDYAHGLQELLSVLAPQQKTEQIAPTPSQVRTDILETKKPLTEAERAPIEEKRRETVEQGRLEVERTRPPTSARGSRRDFFSKLPVTGRGGAAAFLALIAAFIVYWKFPPRSANQQPAENQKQASHVETVSPPPVVQQAAKGEATKSMPVVSPQKGKTQKPESWAESTNHASREDLEQGQMALRAHQFDKALLAFQRGAAAADGHAMNDLGNIYRDGLGVPLDIEKARQWYEKGAAAGDGHAMNNLGVLYSSGRGVPKDYEQARIWYEKGSAAGYGLSMTNLGALYEHGYGVPRDYEQARQWSEKGATAKDGRSMACLGEMYENERRGSLCYPSSSRD